MIARFSFGGLKIILTSCCTEITRHRFHANEIGWGCSRVLSWEEIINPENGFIVDDNVTFEV